MFTIRKLTSEDRQTVRAIDVATQRTYRGRIWDSLSSDEQQEFLWTSETSFPFYVGSGFSFVAVEDGRTVGFLLAYRQPVLAERRLFVDGIAVSAEQQRRGIGAALYGELIDEARNAGVREIYGRISLDNEPSLALHAKLGFTLTQCVEASLVL